MYFSSVPDATWPTAKDAWPTRDQQIADPTLDDSKSSELDSEEEVVPPSASNWRVGNSQFTRSRPRRKERQPQHLPTCKWGEDWGARHTLQ